MDNYLYIPELNPIIFYDTTRANLPKYFTNHFENWMFPERLYLWQQREDYHQIWQTTDIIKLQFESTFDPIIVKLVDQYGIARITLPALIGLPNQYLPGTYAFEISMSLAGLPKGCYRLQIQAGIAGPNQKILISDKQYISNVQIKNSFLIEYKNSRYHNDVMFESGIVFQFRVHGNIGFLEPVRNDEKARDQKYNPSLLNSRTSRQWPMFFGDQFGLPDDIVNLLNEIWSCDNVRVDNKEFGIAGNFEFVVVDRYPKRGVKLLVEEGINRNSRIFTTIADTTKKLVTSVIVDAHVFGDTGNQGSSNTVPVFNIVNE